MVYNVRSIDILLYSRPDFSFCFMDVEIDLNFFKKIKKRKERILL